MDRTKTASRGEPHIAETTGANTRHERSKAKTTADDLADPKEIWRNSETTPETDRDRPGTGPAGRVADAGDIGGGQVSPYDPETQADTVAKQTDRGRRSGGTEKPER